MTTTIEQLRNRPTEHNSKQTDALLVTAVLKTTAPQKAAAVKGTRMLPRAAAARQVAPQKAPAQKRTQGKGQCPGGTTKVARVAGDTAVEQVCGMADASAGRNAGIHRRPEPKVQ